MLFSHGLTTLASLYEVDSIELARIPTIGTSIAQSIKKQLGIEIDKPIPDEHEITEEASSGPSQTFLDEFDS